MKRQGSSESRLGRVARGIVTCLELIALIVGIPAALTFLFDMHDRVDSRVNQAWEILAIDARGNSGKVNALNYLNKEDLRWWVWPKKKRSSLRGLDMSYESGMGVYLVGVDLSNAEIMQSKLTRANLDDSTLVKTNLYQSDFSQVFARDANLTGVNLTVSCVDGTGFVRTDLTDAQFAVSNLTGAVFDKISNFHGASFGGANLSEAKFINSDITTVDFEGVNGLHTDRKKPWYFQGKEPTGIPTEILSKHFQSRKDYPAYFPKGTCYRDKKYRSQVVPLQR